MTSNEEEFDHIVQAWSVGDLRRALAGMPDDLPLIGWVPEEPGGREVAEYVITDAGYGAVVGDDDQLIQDRTQLGIQLEFPSGSYYRQTGTWH